MVYSSHIPMRSRGRIVRPPRSLSFEPNRMANPETAAPMPDRAMPAPIRSIWDHAYDNARRYYRAQNAPDPDELSKHTAWRVLNVLGYERKGLRRKWVRTNPSSPVVGETAKGQVVHLNSPPEEIPSPGQTTVLGKLVELAWIDGAGRLQVLRFTEPGLPDLVWNEELKTLMAFPGIGMSACLPPGQYPAASKMLKRWAQRDAQCAREGGIPPYQVAPVGAADTIVYRSDKWHERNPHPDLKGSQEYLHMFGPGVFAEAAHANQGASPPAVLVQGGKLDVEERGIIH